MKKTGINSTRKTVNIEAIDQALGWVVRLRSDAVCETDISAFADWLVASDQHELAWNKALDTWETAGVLSHMPDLLGRTEPEATEPFSSNFNKLISKWFGSFWKSLTAVSASLALVALFVVVLQDNSETYFSGIGEYQQVQLEDGSLIELNTDTVVSVSLSDSLREIELLQGEAFFTVAPDKEKPFVVRVGGADVQALGTAFNVYRQGPDLATVHVVEGVVKVSEAEGSSVAAAESKMLLADQAVTFSESMGMSALPVRDIEQATAWREGQIVFDGAYLNEAVAILNRYLEHKIVLADGALSSRKVSGIFSSRERKTTLVAVAQAFDLEVSRQETNWLLSQPNP
jgi:transmembrane sensor